MSNFLDVDDWPEAVLVLSKDPFTVAGYRPGIRPGEGSDPHVVYWFEGHHERAFLVTEVHEQTPETFDFNTGSMRYRLLPLTLERYEKHVKARTAGRPTFAS